MTVTALETRYSGHRFRSRLEARWAVLFDQVGIRWQYEEQGFRTSAGPYLPDFRLLNVTADNHLVGPRHAVWFEVKPPDGPDHDPRWDAFVTEAGQYQQLVVAYGLPRHEPNGYLEAVDSPHRYDGWLTVHDDRGRSRRRSLSACRTCGRIGIEYRGCQDRICRHPGARLDRDDPGANHPWISDAYRAANSARFDHETDIPPPRRGDIW